MERYSLKAQIREKTGKGVARQLRRDGLLPAVVYGKNREPQPLVINPDDLKQKVSSNVIFDLDLGEDKDTVMIKEVQREPVTGEFLHIDFLHITMDEKITVDVPITLVGDAVGLKEGGVLQQLLREISIECLPLDIPEELTLDISNLEVGNSLLVSDIQVPENIEIVTPLDEAIVTIVVPTDMADEGAEEEGEEGFGEPETIGEGEAKQAEE